MLRTERQARRRAEGIHYVTLVTGGAMQVSKVLKEMGPEWGLFCRKGTENRRNVHQLPDTWASRFFLLLSKPVTLQMTVVRERMVVNKD